MVILLLHISVALGGIVAATVAALRPSRRRLRLSYGLITATLATGTYLVLARHAPMLHACLTGLAYASLTLGAAAIAEYRLRAASSAD